MDLRPLWKASNFPHHTCLPEAAAAAEEEERINNDAWKRLISKSGPEKRNIFYLLNIFSVLFFVFNFVIKTGTNILPYLPFHDVMGLTFPYEFVYIASSSFAPAVVVLFRIVDSFICILSASFCCFSVWWSYCCCWFSSFIGRLCWRFIWDDFILPKIHSSCLTTLGIYKYLPNYVNRFR